MKAVSQMGDKAAFLFVLTLNGPSQFSSASPQTGPHEGLPGQEAVSTSHTQAQCLYTEVCRLPCLYWKVWGTKIIITKMHYSQI